MQKGVPPSAASSNTKVDPDADASMLSSSEIIPASAQKSNRFVTRVFLISNDFCTSYYRTILNTYSHRDTLSIFCRRKRKTRTTTNTSASTSLESTTTSNFTSSKRTRQSRKRKTANSPPKTTIDSASQVRYNI